jgi:hypothetical protein
MLSAILHPASGTWMLGKIENHSAKPMSREEVEAHIMEHNRLLERCAEQAALIQWMREIMADRSLNNPASGAGAEVRYNTPKPITS